MLFVVLGQPLCQVSLPPAFVGNRGFTSWVLRYAGVVLIHLHLTQVYNPDLNRVELVEPAHRRSIAVFTTPVKLENVSETSIKAIVFLLLPRHAEHLTRRRAPLQNCRLQSHHSFLVPDHHPLVFPRRTV